MADTQEFIARPRTTNQTETNDDWFTVSKIETTKDVDGNDVRIPKFSGQYSLSRLQKAKDVEQEEIAKKIEQSNQRVADIDAKIVLGKEAL